MADNKTKATTEVPDKEDDLQTEDNFESPPEELHELGLTQREDKRTGKRYDVIFTLVNQLTKAIIQCVQSRAVVHQGRFYPFYK